MDKIGIIGLGYVGLGLAVALSKHYFVFGYDIAKDKINELNNDLDSNQEVSSEELAQTKITFVHSMDEIKTATFFIITVPTPALYYELPDLTPLKDVVTQLSQFIKKGDVIVFESTVYPGVVEDICIPILENLSSLKNKEDFHVGYSPERINPHDKIHTLKTIPKVIAAQDNETLDKISAVYSRICDSVYPVSCIKTAEAVKVLENTQRDINIAVMNEFSKIMHKMNLNTHEILEAAKTKWSFIDFKPGFVGGHCIALDPLYLAFKAKQIGIDPALIYTARKINDDMTLFVIQELYKLLNNNNIPLKDALIGVFGVTYKANTPDIRASLALKFIKELKIYGLNYIVNDPLANKSLLKKKYNIDLIEFNKIKNLSVAVIIVDHDYYKEHGFDAFYNKFNHKPVIMDIPNLFSDCDKKNMDYWSL